MERHFLIIQFLDIKENTMNANWKMSLIAK